MAKKAPKKGKAQPAKEYATQRDLELWGGQLQHQMRESEQSIQATLKDLPAQLEERLMKRLDERIEGYTEHKAEELLGVTGDEVKLIQDKQADHEERITKVEKTLGVR